MTAPKRAVLLPVVYLLLASLCQWLVDPVRSDSGTLGMGAPVPVSWEAVRHASPLAQSGDGGFEPASLRPWRGVAAASGRVLTSIGRRAIEGRQERLLQWGRLLLEGG